MVYRDNKWLVVVASKLWISAALYTSVENAWGLWRPAFWPGKYQYFYTAAKSHMPVCGPLHARRRAPMQGPGWLQQSWPGSPGLVQQGRGHLGELVFQRDFLLCSLHRGGRVTGERWLLHSILVLIPACPEGSPAVSKDGCQTRRIACQQQPRLRHHLFMDPLGFPVESIAAGYPLSKTR